ncbi:DNA primase DnaG [Halosegnis marinus]|uniref:DNA primase DnaG n=1 Tax=Halosegnis marinus TaxID=3034023 RepID=A0ABD5ZLM4_9EURY|nr:DNA primase DnaG [Halosegnis sp. DT85]
MQDTAKYLIHADITADGVVERSDVVGAVFGQTEGLLGDDLDLRDLQDSSKVGRIDVEIDSAHGQSFGEITIATSLDKVETAILAAALETIDRVGPCRATIDVETVEDVRAAKRREVVERATTLLHDSFDGSVLSSEELVEEVRRAVRVEDITEYEGLPAGPRVADSDAVIVVEGRADVLQLLKYGIKNAVAVEGTNVPDAVADLSRERTVTAFLDGDRGGELILRELAQVGEVEFVAFAPPDRSVEDLDRAEVMAALREKAPYELVAGEDDLEAARATVAGGRSEPGVDTAVVPEPEGEADDDPDAEPDGTAEEEEGAVADDEADEEATDEATDEAADEADDPRTLGGHVDAVIGAGSGRARLLSADFETLAEGDADGAFELVRDAETVPETVVVDDEASQRLLDVAAQRGVGGVVAASAGEFVKQPASVRVRTADQLRQVAD